MAFIELEDLYGTIEIIVFPQLLQKYNHILNEDNIIYVKGTLSIKEDENAKLIAREIKDISDTSKFEESRYKNRVDNNQRQKSQVGNNSKLGLYLKVDSHKNQDIINRIGEVFKNHLGKENVFLYAEDTKQLYKWNGLSVDICEELMYSLEKNTT